MNSSNAVEAGTVGAMLLPVSETSIGPGDIEIPLTRLWFEALTTQGSHLVRKFDLVPEVL